MLYSSFTRVVSHGDVKCHLISVYKRGNASRLRLSSDWRQNITPASHESFTLGEGMSLKTHQTFADDD